MHDGDRMFRTIVIAAALLASAQAALANGGGHGSEAPPPAKPEGPPAKAVITKKGPQLVDAKGMTLYYFERDNTGNNSTCNGACAEKRPPLIAGDNAVAAGDFTVIKRDDGTRMWAYRYRPLYTSQMDAAPGDIMGDNPAQFWRVARPY
jgi:predicted lipoprotein with Yx(FWY)xxD motif